MIIFKKHFVSSCTQTLTCKYTIDTQPRHFYRTDWETSFDLRFASDRQRKKIRKSRKNNTKTKEIILKLTAVWQKLDTQFVPKFERLKRTVIGNSGHLAGKRYAVWIRIERIMAVRMPTGAHVSVTSSDKSCIP